MIKKLDKTVDDDLIVLIDKDESETDENVKKSDKKIIIDNDDEEKVVKVIIDENGKESIEVYEGKAAEEYLEKLKTEEKIELKSDNNDKTRNTKKIIIEKRIETE